MQQSKYTVAIALEDQSNGSAMPISLGISLLIFSLCLFSFTSKRHVQPPQSTYLSTLQSTEIDAWIFDKTVNNVEFYHMIIECGGKNVVLLKFNNKNGYKVKVSWKQGFDTQLEKHTKGTEHKHFVLSKGEMVQGSCGSAKFREGFISPEQITPTYIADIQNFEYIDIKVTRVQ